LLATTIGDGKKNQGITPVLWKKERALSILEQPGGSYADLFSRQYWKTT